jgi:catechol 2,3-dioxygenase-like lactoylglutathione lyase family enzyme
MSSPDVGGQTTGQTESGLGVDMNLEVVTLPVADVDRAKAFYQILGWRLDIDLVVSDEVRNVQFTPPHSGCSIQFGKGGRTSAEPGSSQANILVVKDIDAARGDLINRGVDVSEVQEMKPPGFDAPGRSYFARASFSDPDGNGWELQEITSRLPGRTWEE